MNRPLYQQLASCIDARKRCQSNDNQEWLDRYSERLETVERELLPHGSGFDSGAKIDLDRSTGECIVLGTAFHHMDQNGMYCGWTYWEITVSASLRFGYELDIDLTSNDADFTAWDDETDQEYDDTDNQLEIFPDYLHDVFSHVLSLDVDNELKPVECTV